MNISIILAGGVGQRLGKTSPKQFLKFNGKTCLEYTLSHFFLNEKIDHVIVVVRPEWINFIDDLFKQFMSKCSIVVAGDNRSQSAYNALRTIDTCDNVVIHDAVRPFINENLINSCLSELDIYEAVTLAVPATDTIIEAKNKFVKNIPNRERLFFNQTPQAFKFRSIKNAYDLAYNDDHALSGFSDDCAIFRKYFPEKRIKIVLGDYRNIKLTTSTDLLLFEQLFQAQP